MTEPTIKINNQPTDNRIFKLKLFSPVGFRKNRYEPDFCPVCRSSLNGVCNECAVSHLEVCPVTCEDKVNYHRHCYNKCSDSLKKKNQKVKDKQVSENIASVATGHVSVNVPEVPPSRTNEDSDDESDDSTRSRHDDHLDEEEKPKPKKGRKISRPKMKRYSSDDDSE
jgi:hypothetical protein